MYGDHALTRAPEDECPVQPDGHYGIVSTVRGVWYCKFCGVDMKPYAGA